MTAPQKVFNTITPVDGGIMAKLAYGKFDSKLVVTISDPNSVAVSLLSSIIEKKVKSITDIRVRCNAADSISINYNLDDADKVNDALAFDSFRRVKSAKHYHITKEQQVASNGFGNLLRNNLFLEKYRYRVLLKGKYTHRRSSMADMLNLLSNAVSSDQQLVDQFINHGYSGFGTTTFDAEDVPYVFKAKKGSNLEVRVTLSNNIVVYSTTDAYGMVMSLMADSRHAFEIHMDQVVLPSEA